MTNHSRTIMSGIVLGALVAPVWISTPLRAADAPSVPVACLCFKPKDKFSQYKAHMLVDDKTRPVYEALIKSKNISLRKVVRLVPGTCTPKIAETLKIANFGCTKEFYHTNPVTITIRSTSGIPLKDEGNKKDILDMAKWKKVTKVGLAGIKSN